jgi:hypothetical protein
MKRAAEELKCLPETGRKREEESQRQPFHYYLAKKPEELPDFDLGQLGIWMYVWIAQKLGSRFESRLGHGSACTIFLYRYRPCNRLVYRPS